jgi:predicted nucleic acid-binding protein
MAANIGRHERVGLDSNVVIYLLEDSGELGQRAGALLDAIARGEAVGILSAVVLTEACSGPAIAGDMTLVERVADELRSLENTEIVDVSADIAVDAAVIRGARSLTSADAIHLACARAAEATAFVTNDRRIKSSPQLEVLYLDEI